MMQTSYDDHQLAATLICCAGCGRSYYMTTLRTKCLGCEPFVQRTGRDSCTHLDPRNHASNAVTMFATNIAHTDLAGRVLYE